MLFSQERAIKEKAVVGQCSECIERTFKSIPMIHQRINKLRAEGAARDNFLTLVFLNKKSERYSYAEVLDQTANWVTYFQNARLPRDSSVAILLPHSFELYTAFLGAALAGCRPALFSYPTIKLTQNTFFRTIEQLLTSAHARMIVVDKALHSMLTRGLSARMLSAIQMTIPESVGRPTQPVSVPFNASKGDDLYLQFSSGTTGIKKGVAISHSMLDQQINAYAKEINLNHDDIIVNWLPLYHDMGMITSYWLPLLTGTPLVALSPHEWVQNPQSFIVAASDFRATLAWMPNFAFNHLSATVNVSEIPNASLRTLRGLINCSEPISYQTLQHFYYHFSPLGIRKSALWSCYAMAETTFAVTSGGTSSPLEIDWIDQQVLQQEQQAAPVSEDAEHAAALVSSGAPLPGVELQILDESGQRLPDRTIGEIALRAPWLANGYLDNPPATAESFSDGWYRSGDLGYRAHNQIYVTGRKKDLIIHHGMNLYPHDMEELVSELPGVLPGRCIALGIWNPSIGSEDLVILAESKELNVNVRSKMCQVISETIAESIGITPIDVRVVDPGFLEKTSSGKLARRENIAKYLLLASQSTHRPNDTLDKPRSVSQRVFNVVKNVLQRTPHLQTITLSDDTSLLTSGILDSLSFAHLMAGLESEFDIVIPDPIQWQFDRFDSLSRITQLVCDLQQNPKSVQPLDNSNHDRDWKCKWFLKGKRNFNTLILGSNRVMALSCETFARFGFYTYNFSVTNARTDDWYCILRFVLENNKVPIENIFLGVDIEAFSHFGTDQRLRTCKALSLYLPTDIQGTKFDDLHGENLRVSEMLNNLRTGNEKHAAYSHDIENGDIVYEQTSEVINAFATRQPIFGRDLLLTSWQAQYKMRLANFEKLSPQALENFTAFVAECRRNNIHITAFLPPLHHELDQFLRRESVYVERIIDFRKYLQTSGLENSLSFLDFSLAESYGGDKGDFIDAAHIGPCSADTLTAQLVEVHSFRRGQYYTT